MNNDTRKDFILTREELSLVVRDAVNQAFRDVGIMAGDEDEIRARRKDFDFLNDLRSATESAKAKVGAAVLLAVFGAVTSLLVLGFKNWIKL